MEVKKFKFSFGIDNSAFTEIQKHDFSEKICKLLPGTSSVEAVSNVFVSNMLATSSEEVVHHISKTLHSVLSDINYPYSTYYFIMFPDMHPLCGYIS